MTADQTVPAWRSAADNQDGKAVKWPINEILLCSLECRGLDDREIAERYGVSWRKVAALREEMA